MTASSNAPRELMFERPNHSRSHYRWQNTTTLFRRLFWFVVLGSGLHLLRTVLWIPPSRSQKMFTRSTTPSTKTERADPPSISNASSLATNVCTAETAQPWRTSDLTALISPWQRNNSKVLHYQQPADFLELGDKELDVNDDESREARCYYMYPLAPKLHFPHAMQQLYRCLSFFRHYAGKKRRWVILHPRQWPKEYSFKSWLRDSMWPFLSSNDLKPIKELSWEAKNNNTTKQALLKTQKQEGDFHDGFVASMMLDMGVEFRAVDETYERKFVNRARPADETIWEQKYFDFGLLPDDARFMAEHMLPTITADTANSEQRIPRIAILNRAGTSRHLSNDQNVARAIEAALDLPKNAVPIQYFENTTFAEQATFFARTDILLSPHGAQLTGLPFMRGGSNQSSSHCRAVVEIYGDSICNPYYFGSLAVNSGLHHSYVAVGDRPCHYANTHRARHRMRVQPVCPPVSTLVEAAVILTRRWQECTAQEATVSR